MIKLVESRDALSHTSLRRRPSGVLVLNSLAARRLTRYPRGAPSSGGNADARTALVHFANVANSRGVGDVRPRSPATTKRLR